MRLIRLAVPVASNVVDYKPLPLAFQIVVRESHLVDLLDYLQWGCPNSSYCDAIGWFDKEGLL